MVRAVLDVNVLVSAVLTPGGKPTRLLERWGQGAFEIAVSPLLLDELEDVLSRPRIGKRADERARRELVAGLRAGAIVIADPPLERVVPRDPGDDYLVTLARAAQADAIVTGDRHLLELDGLRPPALEPRAFLALLERLP